MSGRYEKEKMFENRIDGKLKDAPKIVSDYYYSLIGAGKSYATTYNYINYIMTFLNFIFGKKIPEDFYLTVKSVDVNKYISSLRTRKVKGQIKRTSDSIKTVQWSALNSFFQFLVPDYISSNPVADTQRPKMRDNPSVTYLTQDEITLVLNNVSKKANKKMINRDLCMLKIGFGIGLRVSAIVQIDIDDIDMSHNRIRVTEKGDRDSYVMFGENLKQQINLWLQDRNEYFGHYKTNALFVSQKGQRISTLRVGELLAKYAEGVTDKHVTPHVMRHSCATNLYEKTGDIYLCAKQLHHKNVTTTQRYAEISNARQREAANILDDLI